MQKCALFKKRLLSFIRPKTNSLLNVHNARGIKVRPQVDYANFHMTFSM